MLVLKSYDFTWSWQIFLHIIIRNIQQKNCFGISKEIFEMQMINKQKQKAKTFSLRVVFQKLARLTFAARFDFYYTTKEVLLWKINSVFCLTEEMSVNNDFVFPLIRIQAHLCNVLLFFGMNGNTVYI